MADIADVAADRIENNILASLAQIPRYQGQSAAECQGCGGEIPEARQKAIPGVELCVDCQQTREARKQ